MDENTALRRHWNEEKNMLFYELPITPTEQVDSAKNNQLLNS